MKRKEEYEKDEPRFQELMRRDKKVNKYYYFTNDEIEFMAKHDLVRFSEKFPAEAQNYMSW
ncbi:MAG TPA: hypothetical protein GXX42_12820 [Petrimonas sp.]|uniref:hypothetical protein n=1 Tax=Petrimonas sp. TaxID=2023866 RepID=UPI001761BEE4|nr:hypothetical protein [Petrimonas sp.]